MSDATALRLNAARLETALLHLPPLSHCPDAAVVLDALAGLPDDFAPEQIIAAWPHGHGAPVVWPALLANLGYVVEQGRRAGATRQSAHVVQTFVGAGNEIWVQRHGGAWWRARGREVAAPPPAKRSAMMRLLPRDEDKTGAHALDLAWRRHRGLIVPLLVSSLLVQALGVLVPLFIMVVYDHVIDGHAPVGYAGMLCGLVAVLGVESTLRHLRGRLLARLGVRGSSLVANLVVGHLLHLPAALLERVAISSQLSRLRGLDIIRDIATSPLVMGLLDLPFVLLVLLAMAFIGGVLAWVPLVLVLGYGMLIAALAPWVKRVMVRQARAQEERQDLVLEACLHAAPLRADGLAEQWLERLRDSGRAAIETSEEGTHQQHVLEVLTQVGSSIAGLSTLAAGVALVQDGLMTAGALVAVMMLVWRMLAPLSLLCTSLPRLIQIRQTVKQLNALLAVAPETAPLAVVPMPQMAPAQLRGELEFHRVGLRYTRDNAPVFSNLSFRARAGEVVAIMGYNGSGKSSLLKLVMGFYPPAGGRGAAGRG